MKAVFRRIGFYLSKEAFESRHFEFDEGANQKAPLLHADSVVAQHVVAFHKLIAGSISLHHGYP
jgi:hypothetical protein